MVVEAQGVPLKASGDDQSSSFPSCLLSFVARATCATFLTEQPPLPLTPSQPTQPPWPYPLATSCNAALCRERLGFAVIPCIPAMRSWRSLRLAEGCVFDVREIARLDW